METRKAKSKGKQVRANLIDYFDDNNSGCSISPQQKKELIPKTKIHLHTPFWFDNFHVSFVLGLFSIK